MSSNLFIITAPSGAGKTTLIKKVLEYAQSHDEKVLLSVSHTTRSPRDGEKHGKGTFKWADGRSYIGEYVNDKK